MSFSQSLVSTPALSLVHTAITNGSELNDLLNFIEGDTIVNTLHLPVISTFDDDAFKALCRAFDKNFTISIIDYAKLPKEYHAKLQYFAERRREEMKFINNITSRLKNIDHANMQDWNSFSQCSDTVQDRIIKSIGISKAEIENKIKKNTILSEILDIIRESYFAVNRHEVAYPILGNTGAGKSTVASLLGGAKLVGICDENTAEFRIEADKPIENIVISHDNVSMTKIPVSCKISEGIVWDCPGFGDTNGPKREICNAYRIYILMENSTKLLPIFVVKESKLYGSRGNDFLEAVGKFAATFENFPAFCGKIPMIVTNVSPRKNVENIKAVLRNILRGKISTNIAKLIRGFFDNIHIFYRPSEIGPITFDLSRAINRENAVLSRDVGASVSVSAGARYYAGELLETTWKLFTFCLDSIVSAIPKCATMTHCNSLNQAYVRVMRYKPGTYNPPKYKDRRNVYFAGIMLLAEIGRITAYQKKIDGIQQILQKMSQFAERADHFKMSTMSYILGLLEECIGFFGKITGKCPEIADKIAETLAKIADISHGCLVNEIKKMRIVSDSRDINYYKIAIVYLSKNSTCNKEMAKAYVGLGNLERETNPANAIKNYANAIGYYRELPQAYRKLGELLQNCGKYGFAMTMYRVVGDVVSFRDCARELADSTGGHSYQLCKDLAEYLAKMGIVSDAIHFYNYAASLVDDDEKIVRQCRQKCVELLRNPGKIADTLEKSPIYDYDLATPDLIKKILAANYEAATPTASTD